MADIDTWCHVAVLVGAFSLKEKSPTITVGSIFSADNFTLNGPLFLQSVCSFIQLRLTFWETGKRGFDSLTKPQFFYASKSRGETKGSPFVFFRHNSAFFENFWILSKGTSWFFLNLRFVKNV